VKLLPLLACSLALTAQVSFERILGAAVEPGVWLTYSRNYNGQRYSALDQITTANVARLRPVWVYQTADLNKFEATPLVADGIVYVSEPMNRASALDARTGRPIWQYQRNLPGDIRPCCGRVNRGLAILGDTLYMGTLDAHLVALDARTGRLRWDVEVADHRAAYAITGAPLALKDRIIVGMAGGEYGVRGFLDAYDPATGARLWRFYTTPGPGEFGNETWKGESWKTGGAATWVTGSYDPALNLVYWGTGNPGPDYNGDERAGDNLFSCSVVALDAATGRRKWHFQFTPHDVNDWDSNHVPVLIDDVFRGAPRKLLATANRNAFYYVLDRETGEFLLGRPYAKQTWATGLDERGRPIRVPDTAPTREGRVLYPGMHGGTNWYSPSYSPQTKLFYVGVREEGTTYFKENMTYQPGRWFAGGGIRGIPKVEPTGSIRALGALTGEVDWEFPLRQPPWGGLMATAGGLVFSGSSEGWIFALDARSGEPLWRFPGGGPVFGTPVSFLVDGRQHVALAAGNALFAFALE
jgi:alcohol dehydrogenase (cytochrome c)